MTQQGLVLKDITAREHGYHKIHPLSAQLRPGQWNVLLGKTGAGKTTLMRLMAGLEPLSSGEMHLNGQDITGIPVRQRSVAMVYQQFINYPSMSVYENIASPLRLSNMSASDIDKQVRETADLLKISQLLDRNVLELSGGQQQRTSLARALVKEADLLLMDEPLVNLDYKLREDLRADLPGLLAERNTIIVYATTEPHEAMVLGGQTLLMKRGHLVQSGPAAEIYHQPDNLDAAQAYSDPPMNVIQADIHDGKLILDDQHILDMADVSQSQTFKDGTYWVGVRAHQLSVLQRPGFMPLSGTITLTELTGSDSFVHMSLFGKDWVVHEQGVHSPEIGDSFTVYLNPTSLYMFDQQGTCLLAPAYTGKLASGDQNGAH